MTRKKKNPLRVMSEEEYNYLEKISRSYTESSARVAKAKALLFVSQNFSYKDAAIFSGRHSALAVSKLIKRFNDEGILALNLRYCGGRKIIYGPDIKNKILEIVASPPQRNIHGTSTWSLSTLQKYLKKTEIGHISINTLWTILHSANYSFQKDRTWIKTGLVTRKRSGKSVEVVDPDSEAKKKSDFISL
jgi:transposase